MRHGWTRQHVHHMLPDDLCLHTRSSMHEPRQAEICRNCITCCRLSKSIDLPADIDETFTMRSVTVSSSRHVRRNGARTLIAHVISKPSLDRLLLFSNTPALLMSTFTPACLALTASANCLMSEKDAKSHTYEYTLPPFAAAVSCLSVSVTLCGFLHGSGHKGDNLQPFLLRIWLLLLAHLPWMITSAPAETSFIAVCRPIPSVLPVTK